LPRSTIAGGVGAETVVSSASVTRSSFCPEIKDVRPVPLRSRWGDRMSQVVDPFGQKWTLAAHVKDMTPEEMKVAEHAFIASTSKKP
jgi:hypothetical protein